MRLLETVLSWVPTTVCYRVALRNLVHDGHSQILHIHIPLLLIICSACNSLLLGPASYYFLQQFSIVGNILPFDAPSLSVSDYDLCPL